MKQAEIYGNMKWWDVAEQVDSIDDLPNEFGEAKKLWEDDADGNFKQIVDLLQPFIEGLLVCESIPDWENIFEVEEGSFPEFSSNDVKLAGVDFGASSPLPRVKTEARFLVNFKDDINLDELEDTLEEEGEYLHSCVSFMWVLEDLDDFDLTWGDNQGAEAMILAK
ncbi:MAG: hypothetical protein P8J18_09015 [Halieaceae bacterium]|nr:hypothetical protein [Halieaceae bacterium]